MHKEESTCSRPRIGISANLLPPDRKRLLYINKTIQFAEAFMLEKVWEFGGLPVVVPILEAPSAIVSYAQSLDGLILSGGTDISPEQYGEQACRPEWSGNPVRDRFELGLLEQFIKEDKPVLGICRGHQLINVFFGGTLHQDLIESGTVSKTHRDPVPYEALSHKARIIKQTPLYDIYNQEEVLVNSIHHQGIRDLAGELSPMALSDDGVIESIFHPSHPFLLGVQWHPEWVDERYEAQGILSSAPLFTSFIQSVNKKITVTSNNSNPL